MSRADRRHRRACSIGLMRKSRLTDSDQSPQIHSAANAQTPTQDRRAQLSIRLRDLPILERATHLKPGSVLGHNRTTDFDSRRRKSATSRVSANSEKPHTYPSSRVELCGEPYEAATELKTRLASRSQPRCARRERSSIHLIKCRLTTYMDSPGEEADRSCGKWGEPAVVYPASGLGS